MTTDMTIKQTQSKYNVSNTVLNKIWRCLVIQLNKWSLRNITKIYGSEKKTLIQTIDKHVFKSNSSLTVK